MRPRVRAISIGQGRLLTVNDVEQDSLDAVAVVGMGGEVTEITRSDIDKCSVGVKGDVGTDYGRVVIVGKDYVAVRFHNFSKLSYRGRCFSSVSVGKRLTRATLSDGNGRYVP